MNIDYTVIRYGANQYQAQIQALYQRHRANRNAQQKVRLLAQDFPGVTIDEILAKLEDPSIEPGFKDWRHCLVFWARPPAKVRALVSEVQQKLLSVAPSEPTRTFGYANEVNAGLTNVIVRPLDHAAAEPPHDCARNHTLAHCTGN